MEVTERELKMLVQDEGKCPFENWYRSIRDAQARARIRVRLTRVQAGNLGDYKTVGDGVCELRIDYGPGYRVYFAQLARQLLFYWPGERKAVRQMTSKPRGCFGKNIKMPLKDFNATFADELKDPDFPAAYLEAALEEDGVETFLTALQNVAKANGGMTSLSRSASLSRESMYKALSEEGNPEFRTLHSVLQAFGMRFAVRRSKKPVSAH